MAAIEFALVAPFIMLLMLAGTDLTIFMRTKMRIDETATELALMVTQYQNLYVSDFSRACSTRRRPSPATTPVTGLLGTTIITGIVTTRRQSDDRLAVPQFAGHVHTACSAPSREALRNCRTTI